MPNLSSPGGAIAALQGTAHARRTRRPPRASAHSANPLLRHRPAHPSEAAMRPCTAPAATAFEYNPPTGERHHNPRRHHSLMRVARLAAHDHDPATAPEG